MRIARRSSPRGPLPVASFAVHTSTHTSPLYLHPALKDLLG